MGMPGGQGRRAWSPWAKAGAWLGGLAIAAILAAGIDFHALLQHAAAKPHNFHGAHCTGTTVPVAGGSTPLTTLGLAVWNGFQAGPTHNLVLPGTLAGGRQLSARWRFTTGGSVVMAPAVVDGVAYMGSMDGCVYAVNVRNGHLLWSFAAGNQVMSEPLVVGDRVYFSSGNKEMVATPGGVVRGSGASAVYALNAHNGHLLWMYPIVGEGMPTPAYADGVVYEATGGKVFYAIAADSGHLLWKLHVGSYVSMSSPTIADGMALFGGAAPFKLFAVDLHTHALAWTLPFPRAESAVDDLTPAVAGGIAYVQVPEGGAVKQIVEMAVRLSDGRVLWHTTLGTDYLNLVQRALWQGELAGHDGEEAGVASVVGGRLYVGTPGLHGLWALDTATGAVLWRSDLPAAVRDAPAVTRQQVFAVSNSRLFVLDRTSGKVELERTLGTWKTGSGIMIPCATPAPVVIGHTLIVGEGQDSDSIAAIPLGSL